MPSPFPGMDPYLESPAHWPDFHSRFINVLSEAISEMLPSHYSAALNEQVLLIEPDEIIAIGPDVAIVGDSVAAAAPTGAAATGLLVPHTIPNIVRLDPHVEVFIEVRHAPNDEVVTVIELLSPSNKAGTGRGQYIEKREALLERRVNLVELDLLRGGARIRLAQPLPSGHYHAFISRGESWPDCNVYSWTVRDPLPKLPIPLKSPDADILVSLQSAFAETYRRGPYGRRVHYEEHYPLPRFDTEDADWVSQRAREAT
jgi:uncharacterized protein DUF4058